MYNVKLDQKSSQRLASYLWREFLFSKSFEFTTNLPVSEAIDRIKRLQTHRPAHMNSMNCVVKSQKGDETSAPFDVRVRWQGSAIEYTGAHVFGTVTFDSETGYTRVQGEGRFGSIYYLGLLGYSVLILLIAVSDTPTNNCFWLWLAMAGGIMFIIWRQIFMGRDMLIKTIYDTLTSGKSHDESNEG